ncbi:hypothetical protein ILUMI_11555, partial [Ignelater luminosus]
MNKLKNTDTRIQIQETLCSEKTKNQFQEMEVEESWEGIKRTKKQWMTQEILNLMKERRLVKNKDSKNYSQIQRKIRKRIRQTKEQYMTSKCKELEDLNSRHDTFNVHKKIKEATARYKKRVSDTIKTNDGELVIEIEEKLNSEITQLEVEYAIKTAKGGKALDPDDIPVELLKVMGKNCIQLLVAFFNKSYDM